MWKKNDLVKLQITDMGSDGAGIGRIDGFTVFVKDAVVGDEVEAKLMKVKKSYAFGRLMHLIQSSPYRVTPKCPVAKQCGGCQLQHLSYKEQLKWKENMVKNNLQRIGGLKDLNMEPIIGMDNPYHYRNKAQFPIGKDKEGNPVAGFYAGRTHCIIPNTDCALGVKENEKILEIVLDYMKEFQVEPYEEASGEGLIRHVLIRSGFTSGEFMVCLVVNGEAIPKSEVLVDRLRKIPGMKSISLNVNRKKTNVILGEELKLLWGELFIEDSIGDVVFRISPLSFFQVNPVQTRVLYETALRFADLHGEETVCDLYCGIGTISLFLAKKAKSVVGVEIVPEAVNDAVMNAKRNGIHNARFYVGKAEEVVPELYEKEGLKADVIVVDPPRKGCDDKLLETIVKIRPERVVYVSCDSSTLARDLKFLGEKGYEVRRVQAVDMFPGTVHVEVVIMMTYCGLDKKNRV